MLPLVSSTSTTVMSAGRLLVVCTLVTAALLSSSITEKSDAVSPVIGSPVELVTTTDDLISGNLDGSAVPMLTLLGCSSASAWPVTRMAAHIATSAAHF